jgi:hypothetical protein
MLLWSRARPLRVAENLIVICLKFPWSAARLMREADNPIAICELIV